MHKLLPLFLAGALLCSCQSSPLPRLDSPQAAVECMRAAYRDNDPSLFIHTLGAPVFDEVSAHTIRVAWGEIRPVVGTFVDGLRVIEEGDYRVPDREPLPAQGFVRPRPGTPLKKLVLELDGARESVLFERETDPAPPTAVQAPGFWIGDRYFVKSEHPSPQTYLVDDSPESDRTHWRLVFPYEAFQREGELTRKLVEKLRAEAK